ncbi:hypothetical protein CC86DRAFT_368735 [Ophiobolus disseminans]|uniref:F-box domain-containing protein n=1 Tax=Ophiobolus disseminans TaxID=1469910 RepID=A0A6A7A7F4_9PLEO|nr:hypothetical protein CC86DRAFT_368735 [Ophiobolus disseminans]
MEADALIAAFRRIRTNDSRREAIQALVDELTPYELRTLQHITAARSFQLDIIGQLPVELVAQVFTHLDTSTPYRLQRVSRRWHHILQSPDVLKRSLTSWSGNTLDLQGAERSLLESKAKHIQMFRQGDPSSHFTVHLNDPRGYATLVEDTLAWSRVSGHDHTARAIYLFNISTWTLHTLNGDAREKVAALFASDKLVGFATNGTVCYVWSLQTREKRRFRVPNPALFKTITCRGTMVVCAACLVDHALVYIWDYRTQQGRSFTISYDSALFVRATPECTHHYALALLLQPEDEHIIVFANERCATHYLHSSDMFTTLRYGRFKYTGECVAESGLTLDLVRASFHMLGNQLTPVGRDGIFRMTIAPGGSLQFDENLFKFTEPRPATHKGELWANDSLYWWKDVLFELKDPEAGILHGPILVHLGTTSHPKPITRKDARRSTYADHVPSVMDNQERIYLNDRYIIRVGVADLEVLCFDESSQHRNYSESFFNIGSLQVIDGAT